MRPLLFFLFLLLCSVCVLGTSIGNVPQPHERDIVIRPGLHKDYTFSIGGAQMIDATLFVPAELQDYVTLDDPAPRQGPRTVRISIDFPQDVKVPPSVYTMSFSAREITDSQAQIATVVTVSVGYTIRSYSEEQVLEIEDVRLQTVPEGIPTNFSIFVISRSLRTIPGATAVVRILDENNTPLVTGRANVGPILSGEEAGFSGTLDTSALPGGIYRSQVEVSYGSKVATYNRSILRIGTLTIDLADYTKTVVFNQTNKFLFRLQSNWNKPLTRVSATVDLMGQSKRSAEQNILPFSQGEAGEVYFDRTEMAPGQVDGTMTVTYQELSANAAEQDAFETHKFVIPISVMIVLPQQPAQVKTEWRLEPMHLMIGASVLLCIIIVILGLMLLRKPKVEPK